MGWLRQENNFGLYNRTKCTGEYKILKRHECMHECWRNGTCTQIDLDSLSLKIEFVMCDEKKQPKTTE